MNTYNNQTEKKKKNQLGGAVSSNNGKQRKHAELMAHPVAKVVWFFEGSIRSKRERLSEE